MNVLVQQTQSLIDALRLADQVSCPYEKRYKKNKRYQRNPRSSIARSMPTLTEDKNFPVANYAPRVSIGATDFLVNDEEKRRKETLLQFSGYSTPKRHFVRTDQWTILYMCSVTMKKLIHVSIKNE
uniref:Uncharacterized protein n=1 Tax=Caenorhabditis tropicalis TaxID=1561998 RepID=A0A1I7TCS0_9PELO